MQVAAMIFSAHPADIHPAKAHESTETSFYFETEVKALPHSLNKREKSLLQVTQLHGMWIILAKLKTLAFLHRRRSKGWTQ